MGKEINNAERTWKKIARELGREQSRSLEQAKKPNENKTKTES